MNRPSRDPAARAMVPLSVVWLALAALIGLVVAFVGARRSEPAPAQPASGRDREPARDEAPPRPAWYAGAALLIAMIFAGVAIFGYNQLSHWYRPVMLMATTSSPGNGQQVTLKQAGRSAVQWSALGFVGQLTVAGPDTGGSAQIMLPVPASDCGRLKAELGIGCGPDGITLPSPAEFSWSPPAELTASGQTAAELDIEPSTGAHGAQSVILSATNASPVLCLSPLGQAKLTITVGAHKYQQPFSGFTPCDGIAATIGAPGTMPPSFELDTIDGLTLTASAPTGTLQGFTGQIMLTPGGTSVQGSPTVVALRAAGADRLTSTLQVTGSQTLTVTSPAVASVMTGNGQLVLSEWDRETVVFGPLLGGWVTALVVTPLGVALGVVMNVLKRGPGRRRRGRRTGGPP